MSTFRFSLQKAMDLRRKQFELEEVRYRQRTAEIAAIDRARTEMEASAGQAEVEVRQVQGLTGSDLIALDRFRLHVKNEQLRIARQRQEAEKRAAEQQSAMVEARRRYRLLEKLRERRLAEWQAARDRELDELAAESYLATRGRTT